jgi:uncharacterized protein (UPF0128 family)
MMEREMEVRVHCYAGRKGDERPVRFTLGGVDYAVAEVLEQWYEPGGIFFKVLAEDGGVYVLCRHAEGAEREWSLERLRRGR